MNVYVETGKLHFPLESFLGSKWGETQVSDQGVPRLLPRQIPPWSQVVRLPHCRPIHHPRRDRAVTTFTSLKITKLTRHQL